jgi:hypothetical protein
MAPCFILTSEFADVHPEDEDPMPLNGNPHPLPGQLVPDDNMFVQPEYPEIGWNMPPPPFFAAEDIAPPVQPPAQGAPPHNDDLSGLSSESSVRFF